MSLVNQMLFQLEDQGRDLASDDLPLFAGLSPANIQQEREPLVNYRHLIALVLLCVAGVACTVIYRDIKAADLTVLYKSIPIHSVAHAVEGIEDHAPTEAPPTKVSYGSSDMEEAIPPVPDSSALTTPTTALEIPSSAVQGIAMDETTEGVDIDVFLSGHIPYSLYAADDHIGLQLADTQIDAELTRTLSFSDSITDLAFAHEDNGELLLMFTLDKRMWVRSAEMLQEGEIVRLNIQLSNVRDVPVVAASTLAQQSVDLSKTLSGPTGTEALVKVSDEKSSVKLGSFQKSPVIVLPEQQADDFYHEALKLLHSGNEPLALDRLHQAVKLAPTHTGARGLLANRLLIRNDILRAEGLLTEGLNLQPKAFELSKMLARVHLEKGQGQQAIKVMSRSLPEITEAPEYHAFLATLKQQEGDHDEAIQGFRKVLSVDPGNGKWSTALGISLAAKGETRGALRAFQQATLDQTLPTEIKRFVADKIAILQG